jgi:ABC-type oligopeptide transport system substrate-binding subunit/serine/threonine protein kinase/two-component SAPR family response regulator
MQDHQVQALHISVLGPFALSTDTGQIIPVRGDKVRALLVLLTMETNVVQRRDALMAMFWPELKQEAAQSNLRQTMYRLRKAVPSAAARLHDTEETAVPLLIADRFTVQINPAADVKIDAITFRQLISQVKAHNHQAIRECQECRQRLEEAVALYRDDFLLDLYLSDSNQFENWAGALRAELRQEALLALNDLSQAYIDSSQFEKAEPLARRQLQLDPWRESAHRQLMLLMAQSGRKVEALAQFDECRRYLAEELETVPSAETLTLYERIQAGELDSTVRPGIRIREYIIMEELDSGAFGSIYRAYQPSIEREVVIKVIQPRYANQPEFARRMETEARFVAQLEHPHIVPLYDYWRDTSGAYLVMRWLRRGSLQTRLKQGAMEIDAILRLLDQVASALSETHQQGIVHRDLKPGNIVLDEQENAYLTDFGIATNLDVDARLTAPGTIMGSPAYITPEQLRNDPVTPQTDIYSLGIILFELLTGKLPFRATGLAALIQQHLNEPLPSVLEERPDLPATVDWVLGRATAKDPDARYSDVIAFATSMRQALKPSWYLNVEAEAEEQMTGTRSLPYVPEEPKLLCDKRQDFVARERQLKSLNSFLDYSLAGEGQMACVTGGAGRGKTALINEFARQAMNVHQDLLVAVGSCNVFSSAWNPYLPFRQLLAMLTADVEAQLRAGAINQEHARRLRDAMSITITAIMDHGPELLDVLVSAKSLRDRALSAKQTGSVWAERLRQFVAIDPSDSQMERKRLFSQFTAVLQSICQIYPLIFILDDLQWIDKTSASLLYHLSRHLAGQRLLIVCAYRREEAALGRDGERHPMDKVLSEVKRVHGSIWINLAELDQAEEQQFVNSLLDQEPNKLTDGFRQALFDHTGGHALFTVELLRAMQERGDLVHDDDGYWIEGPTLDWEILPPRIEGVIEERIGRLSPELRSLLNIASVEGELFTAEAVASIEQKETRHVLHLLSRELEGVHHLVKEQEELQVNQSYLTRYRFGHVLIQQYLYAQLGSGERRLLHAQIAEELQRLVQEEWHPFAAKLAWQWQQAGRPDQAVQKWLWLGDQARTAYAHAEAENFYMKAVVELRDQGNLELAARTLMKLGLVYTANFQTAKAKEAYDQAFALWQPAHRPHEIEEPSLSNAVLRLATKMPFSFDPGLIDDDVSTFLIAQLFEGLVRVGQDQNVLPAIASRWEVFDGGTRYIFHIHEEAVWNDRSSLTASDFVYAWIRNLHPNTKSPSAHLLFILQNARDYAEGKIEDDAEVGVAALDANTLEINLERPTAYLPYLMAHTVTFPLPRRIVADRGKAWAEPQHLISNGPYQIEAIDNNKLSLSRNPHYLGQFSGNVESVACSLIDEYETVLQVYGRNQLDVVNLIHADPDTIARAGSFYGKELISIPRWSTFYLCFRCDKPPFDDVRVRQAFAHALDRQSLAIEGFQGQRQAATGGFVPPGMPGHSPDIALAYNPERSRELLSQAGFVDGTGFPEVEWVSTPGGDRVISFLQNAWEKNLKLDLQPSYMDWEAFMGKLNSDPAQLTILGWGADIPDPENMLRATFHSQEGFNIPHWQNAQFDLLTDKAERVSDHTQRMTLYEQADHILVAEETAVLPLSYALGRLLVKPWVRLPITPAISMSFRFATIVRPDQL